MKPRHVCDDIECPVCSPATAAAYTKGFAAGGKENEELYQKLMAARAELNKAVYEGDLARSERDKAEAEVARLLGLIRELKT